MSFASPALSATQPSTSLRSTRQRRRQDRRAVSALRERTPEAMALVMEAYGRTVLGYLTQLLGDRTTAERSRRDGFAGRVGRCR
jgi:hypothetical protein